MGIEDSKYVRELPSGAHVFIYRTKKKTWESPLKLACIDGETVLVQRRRVRRNLGSRSVKPVTNSGYRVKEDKARDLE